MLESTFTKPNTLTGNLDYDPIATFTRGYNSNMEKTLRFSVYFYLILFPYWKLLFRLIPG